VGLFGRRSGTRGKQAEEKETTAADCVRIVEDFFRRVGMDPERQRLPGREGVGWWVVRGSALIVITLYSQNGLVTMRMVSPILYLPGERIVALYRRCLEINMELLNCALGVYQDRVFVVSERPIAGLDPQEFVTTLDFLSAVADDMDDRLAEEFDCKLYGGSERMD
jgi:hypothetical protein